MNKVLKALHDYLNPPDTDEVQSLRAVLAERTELHAAQLKESDAQWRAQRSTSGGSAGATGVQK